MTDILIQFGDAFHHNLSYCSQTIPHATSSPSNRTLQDICLKHMLPITGKILPKTESD